MSNRMSDPTPRRPWRIDVHHHVVPPELQATTPMPVKLPDIPKQLENMDAFGIKAAVTSLTPRVLDAHPGRHVEVARICNEFQASMIRQHPSRFGAFALLPLPDVDASLKEIAHSLDVLKLDGIGLFSNQSNVYMGDPRLDPVFEEMNRRRAVIFMHPAHCCAPDDKQLGAPESAIEYVIDTTRAVTNMLYNGTLARFPDIRFIVSHGGGTIPYVASRITGILERAKDRKVPPVMPALRSLYYDITTACSCHALGSLQTLADPTHLLWGSDLPFVNGPRLEHELHEWKDFTGFDAATRDAIESHNALLLFPRLA